MAARKKTKRRTIFWRINERIFAPQLRVVDSEGKQLGIFSHQEALELAREKATDLVEIAPKAKPPVAKIINFSKFKYQEEKKLRKQRKKEKKGSETKEIWLAPFIADRDYTTRLGRVAEFLKQGHKVKLTVKFKRPQLGHKEFGYQLLFRAAEELEDLTKVDVKPRMFGNQIVMLLSPTVHKKTKEDKNGKKEKDKI